MGILSLNNAFTCLELLSERNYSKIGCIAATLMLIREYDYSEELLLEYYEKTISLQEDGGAAAGPVNSAGAGDIAGIGTTKPGNPSNFAEPGVKRKQKKNYQEANKAEADKITKDLTPILLKIGKRKNPNIV